MIEKFCVLLQEDDSKEKLAKALTEYYDKYNNNTEAKKKIDEMHESVQLHFVNSNCIVVTGCNDIFA